VEDTDVSEVHAVFVRLKVEAARSSEMSISYGNTTWRHSPEGLDQIIYLFI